MQSQHFPRRQLPGTDAAPRSGLVEPAGHNQNSWVCVGGGGGQRQDGTAEMDGAEAEQANIKDKAM